MKLAAKKQQSTNTETHRHGDCRCQHEVKFFTSQKRWQGWVGEEEEEDRGKGGGGREGTVNTVL